MAILCRDNNPQYTCSYKVASESSYGTGLPALRLVLRVLSRVLANSERQSVFRVAESREEMRQMVRIQTQLSQKYIRWLRGM